MPLEAPRAAAARTDVDAGDVVYMRRPLERHPVLPGFTYKLRWPESDHAIYITINDISEQGGRRRPFEIFINSKNMEHYAWTVALTRMISAVFRRGGDVAFVVEELKAVFDPRGGQWMEGRYVPSLLAAIGGIIERHMIDTGFLRPADAQAAFASRAAHHRVGRSAWPLLPQMRRAHSDIPGRLRFLSELRLFQVQLKRWSVPEADVIPPDQPSFAGLARKSLTQRHSRA